MKSGIYSIINEVNGKFYIGSAVSIRKRWYNHRRGLNKGTHENKHLRRAWKKYGEGAFYFGVLEPVEDPTCLTDREQYWMDLLKPEYNICPTAGSSLGVKRTEEQKQKMSGENNHMFGRTGEKNPMFGRTGEKCPAFGRTGEKHPMFGRTGEKNPMYKLAKCWEYNGKSQPLSAWAKEYGFKPIQIQVRVLTHGWSLERAITTPVRKH